MASSEVLGRNTVVAGRLLEEGSQVREEGAHVTDAAEQPKVVATGHERLTIQLEDGKEYELDEAGRVPRTTVTLFGHTRGGWKVPFLMQLTKMPNVSEACRVAGVTRNHAYRTRAEDAEFAAAWQEAIDESIDALEQRAFEVGSVGQTVTYRSYTTDGKLKSERIETRVEPRIMELLLKAHRAEKYVDRLRLGPDGGASDEDIVAQIAAVAKKLGMRNPDALPAGPEEHTTDTQVIEAKVIEPE